MARRPHPLLTQDNWPRRRRWMITILVWMMFNAQVIILSGLIWHTDGALLQDTEIALLTGITAVLGSYVFGAAWDDRDKRRYLGGDVGGSADDTSYDDTSDPTPPAPPAVIAAENATK